MSPVLHPDDSSAIRAELRRLISTNIAAITPQVSDADFISTFIDPEHYAKIVEVGDLIGGFPSVETANTRFVGANGVVADGYLTFAAKAPCPIPSYVSVGARAGVNNGLTERIAEFVDDRTSLGDAFGDAHDAIEELDYTCADPRSMALFLPCLVPVMVRVVERNKESREFKKLSALLKRLQSPKYGALPSIPPEVRTAMRDASDRVLGALLVAGDITVPRIAGFSFPAVTGFHARTPRISPVSISQSGRMASFL